ncbi:MAG TPA: hypothetical protein VIR65_10160 [Rhizorhapis sp.]
MNLTVNKADQAVRERAFMLADSGRFDTAFEIERVLIAEGWPNAGRAMTGEIFRQAIHDRCTEAKVDA